MTQNYTIAELSTILPQSNAALGKDILVSLLDQDSPCLESLSLRFRFEGFFSFILYSGELDIEMNHRDLHLVPYMFCASQSSHVLRFNRTARPFKLLLLAVSKEWIYRCYANVYDLFAYGTALRQLPVISMTPQELQLLRKYYELAADIATSHRPFMEENLRFLSSSILCEIAACWKQRLAKNLHKDNGDNAMIIFNHFMDLASKYYLTERKMDFYVKELNISHQHLSRIVKQISGTTPMHQIDNFLIMEAKNMLIGTKMSIKEISASLNFTNQAVFYRLFKRLTGQLPSDFRKCNTVDSL